MPDIEENTTETLQAGEVRLVVPAAPEYLRLVRLTATGLASRMGFTFDQVEDLRIAVNELCHPMVEDASPGRVVDLCFTVAQGAIEIEGTSAAGAGVELGELSSLILDAVVDYHQLVTADGCVRFRLRKRIEGD